MRRLHSLHYNNIDNEGGIAIGEAVHADSKRSLVMVEYVLRTACEDSITIS